MSHAAVSAAGGLGILGGGYGDPVWLARELAVLTVQPERFGVGFITWSLAKRPELLDLALKHKPAAVMLSFGDPAAFVESIKRANAVVICQVQSVAIAKAARTNPIASCARMRPAVWTTVPSKRKTV